MAAIGSMQAEEWSERTTFHRHLSPPVHVDRYCPSAPAIPLHSATCLPAHQPSAELPLSASSLKALQSNLLRASQ